MTYDADGQSGSQAEGDEQMRIGIDARLVYYSRAGIGQYILQLTNALASNCDREEFFLLQSRKDGTMITNHPHFNRVSLWTPSHHRLEQLALRFEINRLGLDLLHSPDFIPPMHRNCRSVITIHDLAFLLYPHFLTRESARYYGQIDQAVGSTDHIIAVSHSTKQDIIRLLGVSERKITVIHEAANEIYRPIDEQTARRFVAENYGIDCDYILFVSTVEPRKNLPTLLQAYRKLRDGYKREEKLVLAGQRGWLAEQVFATVEELELSDDVHFLGRVSSESLLHLYNAARLLVHPSFYEGFGLPPLEAMTCGTPVVASKVSSLPEVVGDAAVLIDPNDVDELTVAIHRLLTDKGYYDCMAAKGFKRAAKFSWQRAAKETLAVYHRVGAAS
jgi:glycosyltransferase involved in cell wall biosynthesis